MKKEVSLLALAGLLLGCGSTSPVETVFNDVMDAMNKKNVDKIVGYFCNETIEAAGVDIEAVKGVLEASLQEKTEEMKYTITGTEVKEKSTLVNYEYQEEGEKRKDSLEIFHAPSANNANYCVGM